MDTLPTEVLFSISSKIPEINSMLKMRLVSKNMNFIFSHDNVWSPFLNERFPHATIKFSVFHTYCHYTTPFYVGAGHSGLTSALWIYFDSDCGRLATRLNFEMNSNIVESILKNGLYDKNNNLITNETLKENDIEWYDPDFDNKESILGIITSEYIKTQRNKITKFFSENKNTLSDGYHNKNYEVEQGISIIKIF